MPHLWEPEHPYYCADQNFTKNGCLEEFDSFERFQADGYTFDLDFDLNLLFRWDWQLETEPDSDVLTAAGEAGKGTLKLCRMQQRRGHFFITHIAVGPEDEPAVLEYLQAAYAHLQRLWAPLSPASGG
jgi:hypothetical protein